MGRGSAINALGVGDPHGSCQDRRLGSDCPYRSLAVCRAVLFNWYMDSPLWLHTLSGDLACVVGPLWTGECSVHKLRPWAMRGLRLSCRSRPVLLQALHPTQSGWRRDDYGAWGDDRSNGGPWAAISGCRDDRPACTLGERRPAPLIREVHQVPGTREVTFAVSRPTVSIVRTLLRR